MTQGPDAPEQQADDRINDLPDVEYQFAALLQAVPLKDRQAVLDVLRALQGLRR